MLRLLLWLWTKAKRVQFFFHDDAPDGIVDVLCCVVFVFVKYCGPISCLGDLSYVSQPFARVLAYELVSTAYH